MTVPQTLDWSPLSFPVEVKLIPEGQVNQRPGFAMKPESLTWHETANYTIGADADMHSRWMDNGCPGVADPQVGVHFFVDQGKAIQKLPLNEIGWHAGDGTGPGNYSSLSFEFCVNSDGDFEKTFANMAELFGYVMFNLGIDPYYCYQHNYWSGKNCPALLRKSGRWAEAESRIKQYHDAFAGPVEPAYATPAPTGFRLGVDLGWQKINGSTDVYSFKAQGTARDRVIKRAWAQDVAPVSGAPYLAGDRIVLCGEFENKAIDADGKPVLGKDGTQKVVGWYVDSAGNRIRRAKVATAFRIVK